MRNQNIGFLYLNIREKAIFSFLFIIFIFQIETTATVKEIGVPVIQNFERSQYNAGTQNWSIEQANNGVMYFGNNNGLLRYDGQYWSLFGVPNGSNIRSIQYSNKYNILYVGAFNELGYFISDSIGNTTFTSLKNLIPEEYQNFSDVWRIHETPLGIVFQTFEYIFIYTEGKIKTVLPLSIFHFSYYVNGSLYAFDRENGLMEYRNGYLKKIPEGDFFANTEVWSILPISNYEVLIGTAKNGIYKYDGIKLETWNVPVNSLLKEYQIYSSNVIDDNHLAFGTIQNGLIICNKKGEVKQIINREKGLQNNTILSIDLDVDGNLWLGLDNGIDYIEINSPITLLQDYYGFGTGYTSIFFDDKLYLGTNQGLFYCNSSDFYDPNLNSDHFKIVENTSGQVWSLQVINNNLFCGHNNGSFYINNNVAYSVNNIPGCWAYNKIPGYNNYYVEGTYNGLELCVMYGPNMVHLRNIKGINYSCQEVACTSNRQLWISHAFNGLSLFELTPELDSLILIKKYTLDDGLPSNFLNKVKQMKNGDILVTNPEGIFQFDPANNKFFRSTYYNNMFQNVPVQYLQEDDEFNIWYVTVNNEGGLLRYLEDGSYLHILFPFKKLKGKFIGSFFNFNIIDESSVLIALEKGFAHYNPKMKIEQRHGYNAVLNSVSLLNSGKLLYNDLWLNNGLQVHNEPEILYRDNSIRFTYSGIFFEGSKETTFSYFLDGFDEYWSEWQTEAVKEYTNLPDGNYVFNVRSKNINDVIATPPPYKFTILPPWYKSTKAIIIYFILSALIIWFWISFSINRIEKSRLKEKEIQKEKYKEKEEQLKREALEAEKEIIRLRNDKLRANMIHKDKELANTAMNLVQKNKQLNKIKVELKKMQGDIRDDLLKGKISMMIRKIDKETSNDESWSIFETNFEQVHENFLNR